MMLYRDALHIVKKAAVEVEPNLLQTAMQGVLKGKPTTWQYLLNSLTGLNDKILQRNAQSIPSMVNQFNTKNDDVNRQYAQYIHREQPKSWLDIGVLNQALQSTPK